MVRYYTTMDTSSDNTTPHAAQSVQQSGAHSNSQSKPQPNSHPDFQLDQAQLDQALTCLRSGQVVAFPTDTVAGLGVAVDYVTSPQQLYDIKGRDARKPIAWLVSSPADLALYGTKLPSFAPALAQQFWPGPLTLVVTASSRVPVAFASDQGSIGLRMPQHPVPLTLALALGCPLATTSANPSGEQAPGASASIEPTLRQTAAFVIEGGQQASGLASTVVDCTSTKPVILREGSITAAEISACL